MEESDCQRLFDLYRMTLATVFANTLHNVQSFRLFLYSFAVVRNVVALKDYRLESCCYQRDIMNGVQYVIFVVCLQPVVSSAFYNYRRMRIGMADNLANIELAECVKNPAILCATLRLNRQNLEQCSDIGWKPQIV